MDIKGCDAPQPRFLFEPSGEEIRVFAEYFNLNSKSRKSETLTYDDLLNLVDLYIKQKQNCNVVSCIKSYSVNELQYSSFDALLIEVRACRACAQELPLGPRPIVRASADARILIVGQAPGVRVHASGIPWDDASGDRLRKWLGVNIALFHDESQFAIIPMGFCYPGRGNGGDKPPRRECAQLWLDRLLEKLPKIQLTLLIGQYAQHHFLGNSRKSSLTETVRAWQEYAPAIIPLPHPSPRNQAWFQRHLWFESEVLPMLRERVESLVTRDLGQIK